MLSAQTLAQSNLSISVWKSGGASQKSHRELLRGLQTNTLSNSRHHARKNCCRLSLVAAAERIDKEWVLAIDVGTGGTKAALISSLGHVSVSAFATHLPPSNVGVPGSMEQDQESWWLATKNAVGACLGSSAAVAQGIGIGQVRCVAITGQMQDVILLPQPGMVTRSKAILYSDARAEVEADELLGIEIARLAGGPNHIASITGFFQGASSVLSKLRWLDKHESEAVQHCQSLLLGGHDYVVWKLCGVCVTDSTTASTTGLTDLSFQYAEDLLKNVELDHWIDKLPKIHSPDYPCGEVSARAAVELGCNALQGLPVLHVCGDAGACTIGAGAGALGSLYAYLGTSGWVAGSFLQKTSQNAKIVPNPSGVFTLAHPEPSLVFKTGSILNAGSNLEWAMSNLSLSPGKGVPWEEFDQLAATAPAGSGGLLYLPYLNGERCPFEDRNARACFIGISPTITRAHLFKSVMEGVAFAMRSARDAMFVEQLPENLSRPLRLVGGGARSPIWPSVMAGVFGQTVEVLEDAQEVGVKGAAMIAGKWLDWQSTESLDDVDLMDVVGLLMDWAVSIQRVECNCQTLDVDYTALVAWGKQSCISEFIRIAPFMQGTGYEYKVPSMHPQQTLRVIMKCIMPTPNHMVHFNKYLEDYPTLKDTH